MCPAGKPDALEFRRLRQRAECAAQRAALAAQAGGYDAAAAEENRRARCKSHTAWWGEVVDWVGAEPSPGPCTFDRYCTTAPVRNHLDSPERASGGERKCTRQVW